MKSLVSVPIILLGVAACMPGVGDRVDTSKILPVNDIHAIDSAPPKPPPRITRLTLMDSVPLGGLCSVKQYRRNADQAREIYYQTNVPPRTYVVEIGKGARIFPPVSLDIRGSQIGDGLQETENVYVGFSPQGKVAVGTRRYTSTGATNANDRMPLDFGDSAKLVAFANKILELCEPSR